MGFDIGMTNQELDALQNKKDGDKDVDENDN